MLSFYECELSKSLLKSNTLNKKGKYPLINKVKGILKSGSPQPLTSTARPNSSTGTTATTKVTTRTTATTKVTTATTSQNSSGKCSKGDGFYALPGCTGIYFHFHYRLENLV